MYEAKVGESELGKTKKDVMKKVRHTRSDTKKSYKMRTDEDVLEVASKWFIKHWKISLAGEKTNKRLVEELKILFESFIEYS